MSFSSSMRRCSSKLFNRAMVSRVPLCRRFGVRSAAARRPGPGGERLGADPGIGGDRRHRFRSAFVAPPDR